MHIFIQNLIIKQQKHTYQKLLENGVSNEVFIYIFKNFCLIAIFCLKFLKIITKKKHS
jgi:hypothetical protein